MGQMLERTMDFTACLPLMTEVKIGIRSPNFVSSSSCEDFNWGCFHLQGVKSPLASCSAITMYKKETKECKQCIKGKEMPIQCMRGKPTQEAEESPAAETNGNPLPAPLYPSGRYLVAHARQNQLF